MADGSSARDAARQLAAAAGNRNAANYLSREVEDDYDEINNTISGVFDLGMPSTSTRSRRSRRTTTAAATAATPKTRRGGRQPRGGGANATAAAASAAAEVDPPQPGPSGRGRGRRGGGRGKRGRGGAGGRKAAAAAAPAVDPTTPDQAATRSGSQPTATTGKWKVENVERAASSAVQDGGAATANNGQDPAEDSGTVDEQQEALAKDPEEEKKPSESANPSQSAEAEAAGPSASTDEPSSSSLSWIVNSARAVVDTARNILSINTQETVASSTKTDEPDSCQTVASSSQDDDQVDQEDLDQDDGQDDDDDGSVDLEEYHYSGDDYDYRGHGIVTGIKGSHWKRDKVKNKRKKEKPEPEAPPTDNIKKNMESMFRTSLDLAEDEGYLQAAEAVVTSLYPHQMRALYWMTQRENRFEGVNGVTGGILADDMGLGKTLSVISLLMTNFHDNRPLARPLHGYQRSKHRTASAIRYMPTIRGSEQHKQNLASAKKGKGKKSGVAAVQAICNRGKLPDLFGFGGGARRKDTKGKVKSSKPTEVEKPMDFNDYMSESDESEDGFGSMCSDRTSLSKRLGMNDTQRKELFAKKKKDEQHFFDGLSSDEEYQNMTPEERDRKMREGLKDDDDDFDPTINLDGATAEPASEDDIDQEEDGFGSMCNEKPEPFRERVLARSLTITPPTSDEKKEKKRSTPGAGGGSFATHRDEDALDDPELQAALNQSLTTFKEEQKAKKSPRKVRNMLVNQKSVKLDDSFSKEDKAAIEAVLAQNDTQASATKERKPGRQRLKRKSGGKISVVMDDNSCSSDSEDEIKPLAKNKRKAAKAIMDSDDESSTESKGSSEKRMKREDTGSGESGDDIDSDGDLPDLEDSEAEGEEEEEDERGEPSKHPKVPKPPTLPPPKPRAAPALTEEQRAKLCAHYADPPRIDGRRKATLIVTPASLIGHWLEQIDRHVDDRVDIKVGVHHGQGRCMVARELETYDIMLTTYGTLASEFKEEPKESTRPRHMWNYGPLLRAKWLRVVLDEGHDIKNHLSKRHKAAAELDTQRKWLVSGTPIQNNLKELWSLLKWLEYEPYTSFRKLFREQIEDPVKNGDPRGNVRLQTVVKSICLRRTKTDQVNGRPLVSLPNKKIEVKELEFTEDERTVYAAYMDRGREVILRYMRKGTLMNNYAHIFAIMMRLRQLCCHRELLPINWNGVDMNDLVQWAQEQIQQQGPPAEAGDDDAANADRRRLMAEQLRDLIKDGASEDCSICLGELNSPVITLCGHVFCKTCIKQHIAAAPPPNAPWAPCPLCRQTVEDKESALLEAAPPAPAEETEDTIGQPEGVKDERTEFDDIVVDVSSTKINAVMTELEISKAKGNTDKTIVVSQFTKVLSILQPLLDDASITWTRLDGTMSQRERSSVIAEFQDPSPNSPRVLLLSLKAGGVGLNLTAANRLLLIDPAWNPATEDQCFDRIHRLGQLRDCEIVKFIHKDSIEQQMQTIQDKKRELISGAFQQSPRQAREQRMQEIRDIFGIPSNQS